VIFANIATKAKVVVIDRATHKVTDWLQAACRSSNPAGGE